MNHDKLLSRMCSSSSRSGFTTSMAWSRSVEIRNNLKLWPEPLTWPDPLEGHNIDPAETAAEFAGGGGIGDAIGSQGVEIHLVVAPQFEVLDPLTACEDAEGDVQDMVRLVIGKCTLSKWRLASMSLIKPVRRAREAWRRCRPREPLDAIAQFIVNIARGHHGYRAFPLRRIDQSIVNSPLPFLEQSLLACCAVFLDSSTHSKASLSWKNEDV